MDLILGVLVFVILSFFAFCVWAISNCREQKCKCCYKDVHYFLPFDKQRVHKVKTNKIVRYNDKMAAKVIEYYREYIVCCENCQTVNSLVMKSQKLGESLGKPQKATICSTCNGSGKVRHKIQGTCCGGHVELDCAVCKGEPIKIIDDSENK